MIPTVLDCGFSQGTITLHGMLSSCEVYRVVFASGVADSGAQPHYYMKLSGPVGGGMTCNLLLLSLAQAQLVQPTSAAA